MVLVCLLRLMVCLLRLVLVCLLRRLHLLRLPNLLRLVCLLRLMLCLLRLADAASALDEVEVEMEDSDSMGCRTMVEWVRASSASCWLPSSGFHP